MKLTLPCYYQNAKTKANDKADIESTNADYDVARVTIYDVHAVTRVLEDDGSITSKVWIPCGDTFCVPLKPSVVEEMIDMAIEHGSYDGYADYRILREKEEKDAEH